MNRWYIPIIVMFLPSFGGYLKMRDKNNTGADDVLGNIIGELAPVVENVIDGSDSGTMKAMLAIRTIADSYIQQNQIQVTENMQMKTPLS